MPKPPALAPSADIIPELNSFVSDMSRDPRVSAFKIAVNKKTGVVRVNAQSVDGRVLTKQLLGPGLEETTKYDPRGNGRSQRDANIHTLLAKGLTQVEVAERLGVSQALVSRVKNEL